MTSFRIVVATRSINVVRGNEFVMSVPLRVWQPRLDQSGKTTWSSQERSTADRRALIDALVRATHQQSGIGTIRHLVRAFNSAIPPVAVGVPDGPARVTLRARRRMRQGIGPRPNLRALRQLRRRQRTVVSRPLRVAHAAAAW